MFTLHLSRFVKGPPSQALQQLNAWIHQEPYDGVAYCLYWFFLLGFFAPLIAMTLPFMLCYELSCQQFLKEKRIIQPKQPATGSKNFETQLAVVVTGCDSGIGKEMALCLASEGFIVFAGCLKEDSFDHFNGMGYGIASIHPLLVDVTNNEQVQAFSQTVKKWLDDENANEKRYLHAVLNNAGVGLVGYIDWLDLSDFEFCMNGEFRE